jgi:hypothetical protein
MKVQVVETVEVTDEQRYALGAVLDWQVKPKRMGSRAEFKTFVWEHGSGWAAMLDSLHGEVPGVTPAGDDEDLLGGDEDLLGGDEDLLGDDLEDLL